MAASNGQTTVPAAQSSLTGTQRFLSRCLRVFFGHPILYALPAVVITLYGVYLGVSKSNDYVSVGTLSVESETFLGSLSDARTNQFTYETGATSTARQFNEMMQTDGFAAAVAKTAGLDDELRSGLLSVVTLRQRVYATPAGDFLMHVVAASDKPEDAQLLASSAISTFKQWVIDSEVSASDVAETFFDEQLVAYKAEVEAAEDDLTAYLLAHPAPLDPRDKRDDAETIEIDRLNDQRARAQQRVDTALDKREAARQASRESAADIDQRLQIVDAPHVPSAPVSGLRALAKNVIMFGFLGLLVTCGAVALRCLLDSTIISPGDLDGIGATVLAVVPRTKGTVGGLRKKAEGQSSSLPPITSISGVPGVKAIPPARESP